MPQMSDADLDGQDEVALGPGKPNRIVFHPDGKIAWKQTVHIASVPGVDRLEVPALAVGAI